ncbi:MAG: BamA/TamA family outer membrane protein [Sediminibacterium sp.]
MRLKLDKVNWNLWLLLTFSAMLVVSCSEERRTTVKNYPVATPFVYSNKVILDGIESKIEKKQLSVDLSNYWDDSLKARKEQHVVFWYRINNPSIFDSINVSRSKNFMNAYLNSQGYYYANLVDSIHIDTIADQLRVHTYMNINLGKKITIDSINYQLSDSSLQATTLLNQKSSLLKKGSPYSKQLIGTELDRLIGIYRNNGYYKFTREDIFTEVDTVDTHLIALTLNPFKQAALIAESAKKRQLNPTWNISINKRPTYDSSKLVQYTIGNIYYYPETSLTDITDSLITKTGLKEEKYPGVFLRSKEQKFKYTPLKEHTFFSKGKYYNEDDYLKTINTLQQVGAWQQVDGKIIPREKSDTLDVYFFLTPALKQNFTVDLEGSRNTGDIGSGNLFGLSTNFSYKNRNVAKKAIQSISNFRTGVELNLNLGSNQNTTTNLAQTFNISAGQTFTFPGLIQPFNKWKALKTIDNQRTSLALNAAYIDRKNYYKLKSLVGSWGYEWKKTINRAENSWIYKPINIELYALDTLPGLDTLFKKNPFLRNSFNTGNIFSQSLSYNRTINSAGRKTHNLRLGIEETGGLFGLIKDIKDNSYRYIKVEAEYRQKKKWDHSELAYRAFAGIGYNYGSYPKNASLATLPFFKQFSAGGPYSMRAWGLRQLGLGSSNTYDSISSTNFRDRYGDMIIETNVEYRFIMATVAGVKVGSAIYTDIGNIWNVKNSTTDFNSTFSLAKLGHDIAIGVGTGLRLDFDYFLIRFDLAYKVKDPLRTANNGWMSFKNFNWTDIRPNGLEVSNFALQLGIGLPF